MHDENVVQIDTGAPFLPDELLYRAVRPDDWNTKSLKETLAWVEFPRMSVNRGLFSVPADALIRFPTYGVVSFRVGDIPAQLPAVIPLGSGQKPSFFSLDHCPELGNTAHTHVLSKDDVGNERKPSPVIRSTFRESIRRRAERCITPIGTSDSP